MSRLTETDKLKYWLDAEMTYMHFLAALILYQLVTAQWQRYGLIVYMFFSVLYAVIRMAYVSKHDADYLKVPKR